MSHPEEHQDDQVDVEVEEGFDGDEEAAAMAAAMGFSSFGMQESNRPSKKRRFDDGVFDIAASGTGANSLPLHPRESTKAQKTNTDEIDLDGDEDDAAQDGNPDEQLSQQPAMVPLHGLPPKPIVTANEFEPPFVTPPPGLHGPWFQAGGRGGRGGGGGLNNRGLGRGGGGGRDGPNREWYLDYYDPSFNENPWERLEQTKDLPSVGSWLPSRSAGGKSTAKSS